MKIATSRSEKPNKERHVLSRFLLTPFLGNWLSARNGTGRSCRQLSGLCARGTRPPVARLWPCRREHPAQHPDSGMPASHAGSGAGGAAGGSRAAGPGVWMKAPSCEDPRAIASHRRHSFLALLPRRFQLGMTRGGSINIQVRAGRRDWQGRPKKCSCGIERAIFARTVEQLLCAAHCAGP